MTENELPVSDLGLAAYLLSRGFRVLAMRDSTKGTLRNKKVFIFDTGARGHVADYYKFQILFHNTSFLKVKAVE